MEDAEKTIVPLQEEYEMEEDPLIAKPYLTPLPPAPKLRPNEEGVKKQEYIFVDAFSRPLPAPPASLRVQPTAMPKPELNETMTPGMILETYFGSIKTPTEYLCLLTGMNTLVTKDGGVAFFSDEDYREKKMERPTDEEAQWSNEWRWDDSQMLLYEKIGARLEELGKNQFTKGDMRSVINQVWQSFEAFRSEYTAEAEELLAPYQDTWSLCLREKRIDLSVIDRSIALHKAELFARYTPLFESNEGDPFFDRTPVYKDRPARVPFVPDA